MDVVNYGVWYKASRVAIDQIRQTCKLRGSTTVLGFQSMCHTETGRFGRSYHFVSLIPVAFADEAINQIFNPRDFTG